MELEFILISKKLISVLKDFLWCGVLLGKGIYIYIYIYTLTQQNAEKIHLRFN